MGRSFLLLLAVSALFTQPVPGKGGGSVTVIVKPVFRGQPLVLGKKYVTTAGDTVDFSVFKFYLTGIALSGSGKALVRDAFLFNEEDSIVAFTAQAPQGSYSRISFLAGVDSVHNTNGANDGDLDAINGMYWAWNSGYINARLEGHSKSCPTVHNAFEFHIGGYMPPYATTRPVNLLLPRPVQVSAGENTVITIEADAACWFKGVNLSQENNIVSPGRPAACMADRYAGMFSVE